MGIHIRICIPNCRGLLPSAYGRQVQHTIITDIYLSAFNM